MKPSIQIKHLPLAQINAADYNPRAISEDAFKALQKSLEKFGLVDPLIVNKTTGNLISGHQRLKAAAALKLETVPVIELDIPERDERALNVTLNNPNITGFFTDDLTAMLDELKFDFGDDFMTELNLDTLLPPASWDAAGVEDAESNLDGILETIKVRCEGADKEALSKLLKETLEKSEFQGWEVG